MAGITEKGAAGLRVCRKCLLADMKEEDFFRTLRSHIRNIDEDLKVDQAVYEKRLDQCRACDDLISGMCRICGCYVEMRAIMKKNACPRVHPKWQKENVCMNIY